MLGLTAEVCCACRSLFTFTSEAWVWVCEEGCLPLCLFSACPAAGGFFSFLSFLLFSFFFFQAALNRPSWYNATFRGQTASTCVPRETALNSTALDTERSNVVFLPLWSCYYGASVLLMQHVGVRGRAVTFTPGLKHLDRIFLFFLNENLDEGKKEKCEENGPAEYPVLSSAQASSLF